MYLENINGPKDIKELNDEQLRVLAGEIRSALLEKMSQYGGAFRPEFRYGGSYYSPSLCVRLSYGQDGL